mmetsp:Transcript_3008/g.4569  ORF Transcript_3008/g.4569 Transcript_3008/m.4569 type:complete len:233 (-) Transcript_3008:9-707(-)
MVHKLPVRYRFVQHCRQVVLNLGSQVALEPVPQMSPRLPLCDHDKRILLLGVEERLQTHQPGPAFDVILDPGHDRAHLGLMHGGNAALRHANHLAEVDRGNSRATQRHLYALPQSSRTTSQHCVIQTHSPHKNVNTNVSSPTSASPRSTTLQSSNYAPHCIPDLLVNCLASIYHKPFTTCLTTLQSSTEQPPHPAFGPPLCTTIPICAPVWIPDLLVDYLASIYHNPFPTCA